MSQFRAALGVEVTVPGKSFGSESDKSSLCLDQILYDRIIITMYGHLCYGQVKLSTVL